MKMSLKQSRTLYSAVPLLTGALFTVLPAQAAPPWGAYHDQTSAQHQQKFNAFSAQGFRMISLSVYGTPNNPRYAAIWVKAPVPAFQAWHGLTLAAYQAKLEAGWAQGFRPTITTATGSGSSATFGCVLEKAPSVVDARHGIDWPTVYYLNDQARAKGQILQWIDCYGSGSDPPYTAIWEKNTTGADWKVHSNLSSSTLQSLFNSYLADGYRIAHIAVSPSQKYTALWRNDIVGLRKVFWGMTSAEYQQNTDALWSQGYRPIRVQAGGSGSSTRFAAIYVKD
jgi:hypothetical protein